MSAGQTPVLHATLIARRLSGRWVGALLEGRAGVGKSDLALRALQSGWRLVADDRVLVWSSGGRLFGRAPATLSGLLEARGVGVLRVGALRLCEIDFAVACVDAGRELERIPAAERRGLSGHDLPLIRLRAGEPSALAKLERALGAAVLDSSAGRRKERSFAPGGRGRLAEGR